MQYNFDECPDRRGTESVKWDLYPGTLPLWVADMDFTAAPAILEALRKRVEHGVFGYELVPDDYFLSIGKWFSRRHGWDGIGRENIIPTTGVIAAYSAAIKAMTVPGDKVLVQTPVYNAFFPAIRNNKCVQLDCPLRYDGSRYIVDWDLFEEKTKEAKVFLLCNPHNPAGRVWERWEIEKAMALFEKYQVYVISDEIWSDIILEGHKHIPTQSVSEDAKMRTIAVYAPSKTFNLAGLIGSYHIVYNPMLRDRLTRQSLCCHYNDMNVLSMHALIGAYTDEGHAWADELCRVLSKNVYYAYDVISDHFPGVEVMRPQGTYMMFLHCEEYCRKTGRTIDEVIEAGWDVGVAWQQGAPFHDPWGIRMNFAVPYAYVQEALRRLEKYVFV